MFARLAFGCASPSKRKWPAEKPRRAVKWSATRYIAFRTLDACSPFGPFVTSNSTLSPSAKLLKP